MQVTSFLAPIEGNVAESRISFYSQHNNSSYTLCSLALLWHAPILPFSSCECHFCRNCYTNSVVNLHKPGKYVGARSTAVIFLSAVDPVLPIPSLQILALRQPQWFEQIAKNQLCGSLLNTFKNVEVIFVPRNTFQIIFRWQKSLPLGICDHCHKRVAPISRITTAPVGRLGFAIASYRSVSVSELHRFQKPSFSQIERAVSVISGSKANWIIVDFLPYLLVFIEYIQQ